eukprot:scaffold81740_cov61-Phaeocystis_antarctica.AAC.4
MRRGWRRWWVGGGGGLGAAVGWERRPPREGAEQPRTAADLDRREEVSRRKGPAASAASLRRPLAPLATNAALANSPASGRGADAAETGQKQLTRALARPIAPHQLVASATDGPQRVEISRDLAHQHGACRLGLAIRACAGHVVCAQRRGAACGQRRAAVSEQAQPA